MQPNAPGRRILSSDCATPSLYQHNPSDFEQCGQVLNSREAMKPLAPAALGDFEILGWSAAEASWSGWQGTSEAHVLPAVAG
jgi:hypothetical protein